MIKVIKPDSRDRDFYADIAPFFMSEQIRKEMPYLRDTEDRIWYLYFNDQTVVGIASLEERDATKTLAAHHYLGSLYVLPQHRKQGIGKKLIAARMEAVPAGRDARTVCAPELLGSYQRLGFSCIFQRGKYSHMKLNGTSQK